MPQRPSSRADGQCKHWYDAENRIISAVNSTSGMSTYVYDANGQRIRKTTSAGGSVDFLYDLAGHEIVEVSSAGGWNRGEVYASGKHLATYNNSTTYFIHADWLGTERARTTAAGAAYETCTSLPFGDWLTCTGGDPSPMHFTGKERDSESGLDNFGVRYNASSMGRFMSPDPLVWQSWQNGDEDERARFLQFVSNPQNFNLYAYARNNPLKFTDPTGLDAEVAIYFVGDFTEEEKRRIIAAVQSYLQNLNIGKVVVRDAAAASQDKRSFGQKLKDFFFAKEYHAITVDLKHSNPFNNNADTPDFVKAWNMAAKGDPEVTFGDLRQSDPTQWSNIIAWRILHETISHAFEIGPPTDQLVPVGGERAGTLIQGSYERGRPGIPGLNPADTRAVQKLLVPRKRSYVP